jgi:hypothetical protein
VARSESAQSKSTSFTFFRQSDRKALILFVDVLSEFGRTDEEGWRSTAKALPDGKMDQFDVAAQTLLLNGQVLEITKMVGDMLRDWEAPDHKKLLEYDTIWLVGGPLGGVLARELVIRQPIVASKVRAIAWYGPTEAVRHRELAVTSLLMNSPGSAQTTDLEVPLDKFIDRQTARWLPLAGEKGIDVHCANPKPVAAVEHAKFECRSMSIVNDPTSESSPGGTADVERWLSRITRLPSYATQRAKPPMVFSQKLRAAEPLRVSCNSTSYAAPKIVLPDEVKGRIRSAYGMLEDAKNISNGSVKVRSFNDREVFVIAELAGLAGSDNPEKPCFDGEARAVVLVTIESEGGK